MCASACACLRLSAECVKEAQSVEKETLNACAPRYLHVYVRLTSLSQKLGGRRGTAASLFLKN